MLTTPRRPSPSGVPSLVVLGRRLPSGSPPPAASFIMMAEEGYCAAFGTDDDEEPGTFKEGR